MDVLLLDRCHKLIQEEHVLQVSDNMQSAGFSLTETFNQSDCNMPVKWLEMTCELNDSNGEEVEENKEV